MGREAGGRAFTAQFVAEAHGFLPSLAEAFPPVVAASSPLFLIPGGDLSAPVGGSGHHRLRRGENGALRGRPLSPGALPGHGRIKGPSPGALQVSTGRSRAHPSAGRRPARRSLGRGARPGMGETGGGGGRHRFLPFRFVHVSRTRLMHNFRQSGARRS